MTQHDKKILLRLLCLTEAVYVIVSYSNLAFYRLQTARLALSPCRLASQTGTENPAVH